MSTEERAAEIVGLCRERMDRGEPFEPDEVVRAHPDLAAALRRRFAALRNLDRAYAREESGPPAPAANALDGRLVGPYRLASQLGSGGMGTVYLATVEGRARGLEAGDRVAVKVVHPHLLAREGFFKRFLREAEIGRKLRHENVVRTLDADEVVDGGAHIHFFVMEYVEGQTLRSLLGELGRLPEELCRHVGREIAKALAAIHAAGAVHRDLKPDNVLITREHVVKVMDLGVARMTGEELRLSQTGAFVGSVRYAAPEQFYAGGAAIDGRADLYALGLTLYEFATGRHPFAEDDFHVVLRKQMTEVPRPAAELNPQLSPFFEELLAQLLQKDRERRFAGAAHVAQILEDGEKSAWWRERSKELRAETHRPLRRIRIPRETALYGRDAELAKLRALFDAAKSGDGGVVLVEGEAGIGKTRLVDEFVGLLRRDGEDLNFLFGGNAPGGAATASGAFTTAYREQFGDEGLEATLATYLAATPVLVPAFAALLRGEPPPEGKEPLTKDSLQTVFVHATRALAAERATIVLIDDLHFAPEEGRALFAALAMAVPGHRVLLVGTARPGIDEKWLAHLDRLEQTSRMPLARLSPKDLARLLVDAFRSERLAEELSFKIAAKSDGNPYFVFEILRGLRDGQFIAKQPDGTWATTRIIADIEVPSTVKDLIFARIASLPTEERNLLDVAACAGFEFDPVLVGEVVGLTRIPSLQRLAAIEKSHRLVRSAGRRFVFDHHQVAEVLYAVLPEMLREEYHAAIGAALEARHDAEEKDPKDLDGALCVDLAEHFLKGARGERAIRYLDAALTHLENGSLNDAAVRLADRALAAPGLVEGRARCELLLRQADRLDVVSRRDTQRMALDEAAHLADEDGDALLKARVHSALGWHLTVLSQPDHAIARLQQALGLARLAGDLRTEGAVEVRLGHAVSNQGRDDDAREHYERALSISREIGDRRDEVVATGNLGIAFLRQGRLDSAQEHLESSLALAREIGDRQGEACNTGNLGVLFHARRLFDVGRENLERGLSLVCRLGDRRMETIFTGELGVALFTQGRIEAALERIERQHALALELGHRQGEAGASVSLGVVLMTLGLLGPAREHLARGLALARTLGDQSILESSLVGLAELAMEEGRDIDAEGAFREALALRERAGGRVVASNARASLGSLLSRTGRAVEGRALLDEAIAAAREAGLPGTEAFAMAHVAALQGGDAATAADVLAAHGSRIELRETMEIRFLLWQATHDPAHLTEAKRLLDHLVAHAPPDCRESMLANVRLHREILEAATAAGL